MPRADRGLQGRGAARTGTGDGSGAQDEAAAGNGLFVGSGSVANGSEGGSASVRRGAAGTVTSSRAEGAVVGLEDEAIMARFVRDYLGLLDDRVATITAQLEAGDTLSGHIGLLSLESTSAMVGAKELASITGLLRSAVERGQMSVVPALLTAMAAEAGRVHERLQPATPA